MPLPNPLEDFATYNYLFTLACVTPGEVNATSYRNKLNNIIFSSAGRFDADRVQTAYGAPEYFVDNVEMKGVVVPTPGAGNTIQLKINFEIFEPFSMGLFLQSAQEAALICGYKNYLDNAPYCLKLEFKGQKTTGEFDEIGPYYFLCKLNKIEFTVTEAGSRYRVETIPYNHQLFNETINTAFNDIKLTGKTAKEVLVDNPDNSLIVQLNNREKKLVDEKKKTFPDIYSILFVPCDWGGPNPFEPEKGGSLEFSPASTGGTEVFKRQGDVDGGDGKIIRGKMTINPKEKTLQFSQGTSLTNIIDYTVLSTKEARENASNPSKIDSSGYITWWRLDVDIKLLEFDSAIKDYQKEIIFRITPFKVHHTVFAGPESKAKGVGKIKATLAKEYNYIYTGINTDILRFDIQIKNAFFQAIDPNKAEKTAVQANPGTNASVPPEAPKTEASEGQASVSESANAPRALPNLQIGNLPFKAGSGQMDSKQKLANEFYMAAITNKGDMMQLNMEILGDPYWLPENGQGNYHPSGGGTPIADGTMNHENIDIFVGVNFRTPIDARGGDGLMTFANGENKSPFSGLYKIQEVVHTFSGGLYKVLLKGPRMSAQDVDIGGDFFATKLGDTEVDQNSVFEP